MICSPSAWTNIVSCSSSAVLAFRGATRKVILCTSLYNLHIVARYQWCKSTIFHFCLQCPKQIIYQSSNHFSVQTNPLFLEFLLLRWRNGLSTQKREWEDCWELPSSSWSHSELRASRVSGISGCDCNCNLAPTLNFISLYKNLYKENDRSWHGLWWL